MPTTLTEKWTLRPEVIGVYTPRRAGQLAGVSGKSIGRWARYGLIRPTVYEGRPANLYSFFDVAEAIVVRWLTDRSFEYSEIRSALKDVRGEHPDWPLLNAPLGIGQLSEGDRGSLVRRDSGGQYMDVSGRAPGQFVIRPRLLYAAHDMLNHGGWLAEKLGLQRIEVQPLKLGGQPSLRGRRWTVDHVAQIGADDEGRSILTDQYGLESAEIDEAVAWAEAAEALT
jgi:uncharacterized protein (DUF433 family)/DNA-binding transcriptional MerR regulator